MSLNVCDCDLPLQFDWEPAQETDSLRAASDPHYPKFAHLLSSGWIPGRMIDNSDDQYASFRDNVPYLFIVMALHPLLRRVFESVYKPDTLLSDKVSYGRLAETEDTSADNKFVQRISFDVGFSILFLLALHGSSAVKVLIILYINYNIATQLKKEYVLAATWIFNIGILFANELGKGYPFATIANAIFPWSATPDLGAEQRPQENWGTVLDSYGGLIPRWEILFNVTVLRLISFNLDYYWSLKRSGGSPIEVCDPENSIFWSAHIAY